MEAITADSVLEKVRSAIAESLGIELKEVTPESSFVSLGADSLERAQLMIEIEEVLGIEIPDDDFLKLQTVANVVAYANTRSH